MPDPRQTAPSEVSTEMRDAAVRVLDRDGRDFVLQPWQAGWLIATSEGRLGFVPAGCGVGVGWLQARLDEERVRETES